MGEDAAFDRYRELIAVAEDLCATHHQAAKTFDDMAERGGPHAARRRQAAEHARAAAAMERAHIAHYQAKIDGSID
jgi:hypothetical protein